MTVARPKVPKEWIRDASDRYAIDQGCWFDEAAGRRVCDFVERFCRQSQGRWAGKPLRLMDWQRDWLMRGFGWMRSDGTRRFRRIYLEVPKKNGKSTLVSAIVLYLLVADFEGGPKVYINACDREQAKVVYDEAVLMVESSPALSARLTISRSTHKITYRANNGAIRANSADAPSKDGANASSWIFDEIHRQPKRDMYDIFRYAGDARDQPLEISITTAGETTSGIWYELREYSQDVTAGTIPDISHFGTIYAASEDDDLTSPETWKKANPSFGQIIKPESFAEALNEAKQTPEKWANFLRLKLGIVTTEVVKAFDLEAWRKCSTPLRDLAGRTCFGGYDLSQIRDLSAWVLIFPDDDGTFDLLFRCWVPEENVAQRERGDRVPYRQWERLGEIAFTPGGSVNYGTIEKQIIEDHKRFKIKSVFADPWNAEGITRNLMSQGVPVKYIRQGWSLNSPTKELQRLIIERKFRHNGHRVATWCCSNAVFSTDENQNVRLSKSKSRERIDLMSALVNAIGAYQEAPPPSVYSYRGVRRV